MNKTTTQQTIIIVLTIMVAIMIIMLVMLNIKMDSTQNKVEGITKVNEELADYISDEKQRVFDFFSQCDLDNDADFIDNIEIVDNKLCFDCNILTSYDNSMIQSSRRTICSK